MPWETFVWATVLGLALDIIGFCLVIKYGHSLFLWAGSNLPSKRKDDVVYLQSDAAGKDAFGGRRFWARFGVALVIIGFGFQIVGAIAAIQSSN